MDWGHDDPLHDLSLASEETDSASACGVMVVGKGSFSRTSSSALTATISDDPDIDRAAISG